MFSLTPKISWISTRPPRRGPWGAKRQAPNSKPSALLFTTIFKGGPPIAGSDVEAEVHDVAVLDDVGLAFLAHLAGLRRAALSLEADIVVVGDGLGGDEALLEIGVDL